MSMALCSGRGWGGRRVILPMALYQGKMGEGCITYGSVGGGRGQF